MTSAAGSQGVQVGDTNVQVNYFGPVRIMEGASEELLRSTARTRPGPWRVFISRTGELGQFPQNGSFVAAAKLAIERAGHAVVEMDSWSASPLPSRRVCIDRLGECDVYVGLVGFRYGSPVRDDEGRSYTELEFDVAAELGLPRLMFVLADDLSVPVPRSFYVDTEHGTRQEAFRRKVDESGVTRAKVDGPQRLDTLLYQALVELPELAQPASKKAVLTGVGQPTDEVAGLSKKARAFYESRVRERYRRLELDALTPRERDEHVPVLLGQVFVPQSVRAGSPPLEVSKEVWRKLVEAQELPESDRPHAVEVERWQRSYAELRDQSPRPVLEVLAAEESRLVLLLGDPGSGKSTLARFVALVLAASLDHPPMGTVSAGLPAAERWLSQFASWLPVVVELRSYADDQGRWDTFAGYLDFLHRTDEGPGLSGPTLERFLREDGRAWVIFDGLDELFVPKAREAVARQIAGFAARYPKVRVLITSRPIGCPRQVLDAAGFTTHTLQDLDQGQIEAFLSTWYQVAYHDNITQARERQLRLLRSITASTSIRELAGNPLLLTILAIIGKGRELPRDRQAVYAHAAAVLVYHWDVDRHLSNEQISAETLDVEDRTELLRRVARLMQSSRGGLAGNYIDGNTLTGEFEKYLVERYDYALARAHTIATAMLRQLRERNFILSLFGAGIYGFVHRAFLEYFCADDLRHQFEKTKELSFDQLRDSYFLAHWRDDAWREVLLLVADMIDDRFTKDLLVGLLGAYNSQRIFLDAKPPYNLSLATRIIADARQPAVFAEACRMVMAQIQNLLSGMAQREWSRMYGDEVGVYIKSQLVDVITPAGPRWPCREEYQDWFARYLPVLVVPRGYAYQAISSEATGAVSLAIGLFGSASPSRRELQRQFRSYAALGATQVVRWAAIRAVGAGWAGDVDALGLLCERAIADPHEVVRRAAIEAVGAGWAGDVDTLGLLCERVIADLHEVVRWAAIRAVGAGWPGDVDALGLLRERAIADPHEDVRWAAIEAVAAGWAGDVDTLGLLCERAIADLHEVVRWAAIRAVGAGWAGDVDALGLLRERAIDDPHEVVRWAAIEAVGAGWAGDVDTLGLLRERAIDDPHEDVRWAAIRAVGAGWAGDIDTLGLLRERAIDDRHWVVRRAAIRAVAAGWAGGADALGLLRERAIDDPHEDVRCVAIEAVAAGWAGDLGTLAGQLADPTPDGT